MEPGSKSRELYDRAVKYLPGGISRNTIFRRPNPDYFSHGEGCYVTDVDGVQRIDFANNMASLIHGHVHPAVVEAVTAQLQRGSACTMATEAELDFACHMCSRNIGFEKIRFMNSGTEAVMAAIKAARAITGRPAIAKSEGAYHGTYDYAEVSQKSKPDNWGDSDAPTSVPVAEGTPRGALNDVIVIPFNDIERSEKLLNEHASRLACVLIDPLPHRVGLIPASGSFMNWLRRWTRENDVLLVLDEVITFRMGFGGAQQWFDVLPDLTAMGKIIGGGFPVGALAGQDRWMSVLDPSKDRLPFPYSGTFSANPVTMTAGLTAMQLFDNNAVDALNQLGDYARQTVRQAIDASGVTASVTGAGSMFRLHFKAEPPVEYRTAYQDQRETAAVSFLVDYLYKHGCLMINTCSAALSTVTTKKEIDQLGETMEAGLRAMPDELIPTAS